MAQIKISSPTGADVGIWEVGMLATADGVPISNLNPLPTTTGVSGSTSAALASVAGSTSSVVLLAANTSRRGGTLYNDSTANLYMAFHATASTTAYTIKMVPASYYEIPFGYVGVISGIWDAVNGNARITELS